MTKVRKIFGTNQPINFNSKEDNFDIYWKVFYQVNLVKYIKAFHGIPW